MLSSGRYGTRDLERAKIFYDGVAEVLGAQKVIDRPDLCGYQGSEGGMLMIGTPFEGEASVGNGSQMALMAPSRDIVNKAHAKALELGGRCDGPPGPRGAAEWNLYAAYVRDPDGNKLAILRVGQD